MEIVDAAEFEEEESIGEDPYLPSEYLKYRENEDIPVHGGLYIEDVNEVEVGGWDRTQQKGAFVNLFGSGGINDIQIHEIEPNGKTSVQRHFHDAMVYVSEGDGFTTVGEGNEEETFEWSTDTFFFLPPNTPYQYTNAGDSPARLVVCTTLPFLLTVIKEHEFIFNCDYDFWSSYDTGEFFTEGGLYQGEFPKSQGGEGLVWETNFVPDLNGFENVKQWREQAGNFVFFHLPHTSTFAHVAEFEAGTYKKAHRHQPGAQIVNLAGVGYSLMWKEDWDQKVSVEWKPGSLFTPPEDWFHQHFNVTETPSRYLAYHIPEMKLMWGGVFDPVAPENEIDYNNEDEIIREYYADRLADNGLELEMPEAAYTEENYEWNP